MERTPNFWNETDFHHSSGRVFSSPLKSVAKCQCGEYIYAWLNAGHNLSSTDNDARVHMHKHTQWMQYQLEVSINSASWKWIPFGWIASSKFQLAAASLTLIVFEELCRLRERTLSSILIIMTSIQLSMEILFEVQRRSRFHTCAPLLFVELFFQFVWCDSLEHSIEGNLIAFKSWLLKVMSAPRLWPQVLNGRDLSYSARVLWSKFRRPHPRIRVKPENPLDTLPSSENSSNLLGIFWAFMALPTLPLTKPITRTYATRCLQIMI